MKKSYVLVIIFFVVLVTACYRDPGFSAVPAITYKSVEYKNTPETGISIKLKINFTDGDGDLGLTTADSTAPFNSDIVPFIFGLDTIDVQNNLNYFNLRVEYLFKINDSTYSSCLNLADTCSHKTEKQLQSQQGRFLDLNPDRKARPISGELTYNINSLIFASEGIFGNTLKLKIFILDRKLNQSNVIETDTFRIE